MNNRGYTLVEVLVVLFIVCFWGGVIYIAIHFINKFW